MSRTRVKVAWDAGPAIAAAEEGGKKGLEGASRVVLVMADPHVPWRSGQLARSGQVDFDGKEATVYYDTAYAVKLHQDRRLKIRGGREGLWLKKASMRSRPHVVQYFKDALKVRFRSVRPSARASSAAR